MIEAATPAPAAWKSIPLRPWMAPVGLFGIRLAVDQIDGRFLPTRDAVPNLCLPVQIMKWGSMSFSPRKIDGDAWDHGIQGRKAGDLLAEAASEKITLTGS